MEIVPIGRSGLRTFEYELLKSVVGTLPQRVEEFLLHGVGNERVDLTMKREERRPHPAHLGYRRKLTVEGEIASEWIDFTIQVRSPLVRGFRVEFLEVWHSHRLHRTSEEFRISNDGGKCEKPPVAHAPNCGAFISDLGPREDMLCPENEVLESPRPQSRSFRSSNARPKPLEPRTLGAKTA